MPDFGYWSWPLELVGSYSQIRAEIMENEVDWDKKTPKAVWRGAAKTNKLRADLLEATRGQRWADVQEVFWNNRTDLRAESAATALSMAEHCAYQFVIQTEGKHFSCAL